MNNIPFIDNPVYTAWRHMKERCYNPKHKHYAHYGGRGIKVCESWRQSATQFMLDIGAAPSAGLSIDRISNNGNYSCGYCVECRKNGWLRNLRWANQDTQNWNRRYDKRGVSGYIGVSKHHSTNSWCARIRLKQNGISKTHYLGTYKDIEEAALEYDKAVIFFRGTYVTTNFL